MAIPPLTTEVRVRQRLSTPGVNLRTDHFPDGTLAECILSASCDVAVYLTRFPLTSAGGVSGLDSSDVVKTWVADVVVYHLCRARANPIPVSVKERFEWVFKELAKIQAGQGTIPDIATANTAPAVINRVVQLGSYPAVRRVAGRSVPPRPTGFPSHTDRSEPPPYQG